MQYGFASGRALACAAPGVITKSETPAATTAPTVPIRLSSFDARPAVDVLVFAVRSVSMSSRNATRCASIRVVSTSLMGIDTDDATDGHRQIAVRRGSHGGRRS